MEKEYARIIVWPISHINSFDFFSKANGVEGYEWPDLLYEKHCAALEWVHVSPVGWLMLKE